ncbi:MAG: DUF742 domain-containing protein [Streptosporangiaceae bacterium]
MGRRDERWVDEAAGPVVRPYAISRGRTRPRGEPLDLVTILAGTGDDPPGRVRYSPEELRLLELCRSPCTVADLASDLNLPLGVVRVLAGDLVHQGLLEIRRQRPATARPDQRLLQKVLDDLKAL